MLILKFEELRQSPNETLSKVASFLGIPDFPAVQHKEVHSRPYLSPPERGGERDYLRGVFYYEIKQLEHMLGWDCEAWLT